MVKFLFSIILFVGALAVHADVVINGQIVVEEAEMSAIGAFIRPNETRPEHWAPIFAYEKGGTLISVGTFRTLISAGLGSFDRVIMLDFDGRTNQFNRDHLALIQKISLLGLTARQQRYQYVAVMSRHWFSNQELEALEKQIDDSLGGYHEFALLKEAIEHGRILDEERQNPLEWTWDRDFGRHLIGEPSPGVSSNESYVSVAMRDVRFYWETDLGWTKIVELIQKERIAAICGNLAGETTMASLGIALAANEEFVSVLDPSNAMETFNADAAAQFLKNLSQLPFSPTGAVVFTAEQNNLPGWRHFEVKSDFMWGYLSASIDDFLETLENAPKTQYPFRNIWLAKDDRWNPNYFVQKKQELETMQQGVVNWFRSLFPNLG